MASGTQRRIQTRLDPKGPHCSLSGGHAPCRKPPEKSTAIYCNVLYWTIRRPRVAYSP